MKDKVVVLFSGGLDSTTLLYHAVSIYGKSNVIALNMQYGQKHMREIQCAEMICDSLGIQLVQHDVSAVFEFSNSSMLAKGDILPTGDYAGQLENGAARNEQGQISTFVPFRNGLFLSCAAAVAYSLGAKVIAYGAHSDDAAGEAYPDCSKKFVDKMDAAIYEGTGGNIRVWAPFAEMNKAEIVGLGITLKIPYEFTWSCYAGEMYICEECGTCIDRAKAFELNGKTDPLITIKRMAQISVSRQQD